MGAAWALNKQIVPVCHSGLTLGDLGMPLLQWQGLELGGEMGLRRLYKTISDLLPTADASPFDIPAELERIRAMERKFVQRGVRQYERYIDVVLPAGMNLGDEKIPPDAPVFANRESWEIFGLAPLQFDQRTWADIESFAEATADKRWLAEIQKSVCLASKGKLFRPIQAVFHGAEKSYQPQLAKWEVMDDGQSKFHIHMVETVVAPLRDVPSDVGLLATLLRLGMRFRFEVIELGLRFLRRPQYSTSDELDCLVTKLRTEIEIIERDAKSRGSEKALEREDTLQLFMNQEQKEIEEILDAWVLWRGKLFAESVSSRADVSQIVEGMRDLNYRFMWMGTKRYHEMVGARWYPEGEAPIPAWGAGRAQDGYRGIDRRAH
ncbi:hypothetical protein GCM10027296_15180 [Chitinimonas naiadis]